MPPISFEALGALFDIGQTVLDSASPPSESNHSPGDPWAEKRLRRLLTDRWAQRTFVSALVMMGLIIFANGILAPLFHQFINIRPSRFRQKTFALPWINMSMVAWSLFLALACIMETKFDLLAFSKRLGRISVSLMAPMYLLTLRPSPLPRTFYLQVMPMHKWLSRFVVCIAALHGMSYTLAYWRQGSLWKLTKFVNYIGIIALSLFIGMAISGWQKFRSRFYECFYAFHIISAWSSLLLIQLHARPPCTGYMEMCLALLLYQVCARIYHSTTVKLRVANISSTMVIVIIPRCKLPVKMQNWSPASHMRLSNLLYNPITWLRSSHPYTIASLPDDDSIKLVIRKGDYKITMRKKYSLFGPHRALPRYIETQLYSRMMRRVLLVVGGSGVAFGAPLMRFLRANGAQVRMIWAIRDPYDAKILPQIGLHDDMLAGNIEVYYTGDPITPDYNLGNDDEDQVIGMSDLCCMSDSNSSQPASSTYGSTTDNAVSTRRFPRHLRADPILCQYTEQMYNHRAHLNLRLKAWLYGYDLDNEVCCCADRILESCPEDRLGAWVLSSGGPNLVEKAKQWAELSGVCFFAESFTL